MSEDNGSSKLAFFLAGMGLGAVVALLLAPRSGKETREFISNKAGEGREYITQKAEEGREFVSTRSRELRTQAEGALDKAKDVVSKQKEQLSAALEAGKQAYQEEKGKTR
jgi:gas vesicle protein